MRCVAPLLALLFLLAPAPAFPRGHGGGHASSHAAHVHRPSGGHWHRSRGKTRRDPEQRRAFMRSNPCPATGKTHGACPGYVVDHIVPLKRGGPDAPSNMQWQTVADGKAKDKWE